MNRGEVFDQAAIHYDSEFSQTPVGLLQREQVRRYLNSWLGESMRILEINCGTGEDAMYLAAQGHSVLATDSSKKMIELCQDKMEKTDKNRLEFQQLGFAHLDNLTSRGPFDLVFSNFSGLNCVNPAETERIFRSVSSLLTANGLFFAVYFGTRCLWERWYFGIKGDAKKYRRSENKPAKTLISGNEAEIWYYRPETIKRLGAGKLEVLGQRPVGLFTPPSYLNFLLVKYQWTKRLFRFLDQYLAFPRWANYADHYAIVLRKIQS